MLVRKAGGPRAAFFVPPGSGEEVSTGRIEETVSLIASRIARAAGLEVYDVTFGRSAERWILTVYIDRPGGAVTLDDCQTVSEQLGAELEAADPVPHAYTLEVSSPGLDRPLRTEAHWRGAVGLRVRLSLLEARDGRRRFSGRLEAVEEGRVTVALEGAARLSVGLPEVASARLEPEF